MHVGLIRNLFFSVKNELKRFVGRRRSSGRKANLESQSILITHGRGAHRSSFLTPHFTRSGRIYTFNEIALELLTISIIVARKKRMRVGGGKLM